MVVVVMMVLTVVVVVVLPPVMVSPSVMMIVIIVMMVVVMVAASCTCNKNERLAAQVQNTQLLFPGRRRKRQKLHSTLSFLSYAPSHCYNGKRAQAY
jgi:uncharacterized membrane protein